MAVYTGSDADLAEGTQIRMGASANAAAASGRYEGSVKRESDGATYLRAIELGTPSRDGSTQPIRVFDQLGGVIPPDPQASGDATALGPFLVFNFTDSVAKRRFICVAFGANLISTSTSVYHDGRPDSKLAGLLRKV